MLCCCERVSDGAQSSVVAFSGGTGFNGIASKLKGDESMSLTHVLPLSDDGGSSAEVVRAVGGPALGDIRSRCLSLADDSNAESVAVRDLLAYRLSMSCRRAAEKEWLEILSGGHVLWSGISPGRKQMIHSFLSHFERQVSNADFDFRNGSVGNFFFAGARTFFSSLEAAIFVFSRIAKIPENAVVLPALLTEERLALSAELEDRSVIHGQNRISHPTGPKQDQFDVVLSSRIQRVYYSQHEKNLRANPAVLNKLATCDAVIYGMGSLFTSICPSLILPEVGAIIAKRQVPKILILNGSHDRETKWESGCMTAAGMIRAITEALNSGNKGGFERAASDYVNTIIVPEGGEIHVDCEELAQLQIHQIYNISSISAKRGVLYQEDELAGVLRELCQA